MYLTEGLKKICLLTAMFFMVVLGGLFIWEKGPFAPPNKPALAASQLSPEEVTPNVTTDPYPGYRDGIDQDCPDVGFKVWVGTYDPDRLDADGNGWGCESYPPAPGSSSSTIPQPNYQEFMTLNCQNIIINFNKSTDNDFGATSLQIECFKWFAQQFKNGKFSKIIVEGRSSCDSFTPQGAYNISEERADWGRNQLLKYGVSYSVIETQPLGDQSPLLEKGNCSSGAGADHNRSILIRGE